mmetsp:Transcript_103644/g.184138  ORF Transcript_103644/g.184138 Transcript_103644/m.184138 type:complete len:94 (-) Transcript_103644:382-663(-)
MPLPVHSSRQAMSIDEDNHEMRGKKQSANILELHVYALMRFCITMPATATAAMAPNTTGKLHDEPVSVSSDACACKTAHCCGVNGPPPLITFA